MGNKYPAKYITTIPSHDRNYVIQFFEYRGKEYQVTKPISWMGCSSDYLNNGSESLRNQHKREQESIDARLDNPEIEFEIRTTKCEAEIALDKFLAYINGDDNAFD